MSTREIQEQAYPFSWLDEIVEVTLNPAIHSPKSIKPAQLQEIGDLLPAEIRRISHHLKNQAFGLYVSEQVKVVAGHYDQAIRLLQRQARQNQDAYPKNGMVAQTGLLILQALDGLSQSIHHRYSHYLPQLEEPPPEKSSGIPIGKILCALSADQIGILLRAALDVKLILSTSMRKLCQLIAPLLSTRWKAIISWDTLRSNAGRPEARDKDVAIQFLEKMIEKIRGYR